MSTLDVLFASAWGPLVIFCLRIFDVSFSTMRIILSVRNARWIVPVLAFFEVLIWILAAGNAIRHLSSPVHLLGYTTGFAAGTWVGLWIEQKLAFGWASVQVVSRGTDGRLAARLRDEGCAVTELGGTCGDAPLELLQSVVKRRALPALLATVDACDPDALVTVEQPNVVRTGWLLDPRPQPVHGRVADVRRRARAPRVPEPRIASRA